MTKALVKSHAEGTLELPWASLNTKGVPSWRAATSQGPTFSLQNHAHSNSVFHISEPSSADSEVSHTFSCPKCMCNRDISNCSLLVRSGWGHILCFTCRLTSRSMTWRCICGVPWHTCTVHSSIVRQGDNDDSMLTESLQLVPT